MSCVIIDRYLLLQNYNVIIINTRLFPVPEQLRNSRLVFKIMEKKKKNDVAFVSMTLVADRDYRGTIPGGGVEKNKGGNLCYYRAIQKNHTRIEQSTPRVKKY